MAVIGYEQVLAYGLKTTGQTVIEYLVGCGTDINYHNSKL